MGSLTRANQLITGKSPQVSVFTLNHWTQEADKPLGARPRRSPRVQSHTNRRARLLFIKIQEAALNYLIQWLLLEESERQDRCSTAAINPSRRMTPTSVAVGDKKQARNKKVTRSSLLMKDVAKLPGKRDFLTMARFIFWRWLTWANLLELVLICLLMCCCAYQCYELLDDYFTYPTHVTVTQIFNDDFRADLPAITICDNNRISLERLRQNYPEYNESHYLAMSLGTFYSLDNFSINPSSVEDLESVGRNDWMLYGDEITSTRLKSNIYSSNFSRQDDTTDESTSSSSSSSTTMNKPTEINWARVGGYLSGNRPGGLFNFLPDYDLVETLLCANVWGEQMPCQRLRRVQTIQHASLCNTLFHDSVFWDNRDPAVKEIEDAIQKRPSTIKFGNQVTGGELLEFTQADKKMVEQEDETDKDEKLMQVDIANMEMIRIRLNFRRHDYASKRGTVGGRIAVHSNSFIGEVNHKAYHLKPGFWYNYYVDRFDYQRLPPPYSTKCYDYGASRYVWLDRLKWRQTARPKIQRLIKEQANSPNKLVDKYVELLRGRSMGKRECMKICKIELPTTYCGCYALGEIWGLNNTLDYNRTMKWCDLDKLAERINQKSGINSTKEQRPAGDDLFFQLCSKRYSKLCALACPDECFYSNFDVIQQARSWPSHEAQVSYLRWFGQ